MLLVYDTATDISTKLEEGSVSIDEQMSNRKSTAKFTTLNQKVSQGKSVYIYEALELRQSSNSGTDLLYVTDTYPECFKFAAGDEIIVDIKGAGERKYTVLAVSDANRTIQLTTNLLANVVKDTTMVGRLIYGGVVQKNPEKELGNTGTFEYDISCVDWGNLLDRKVVVQEYQSQYSREIIGRICYNFVSFDSQLNLDDFESAWTQSAQGLAMADETTDRIHMTKSQKTGTSGAGTGIWTKTITSADISAYTHVRFWWKEGATYGGLVSSLKLRLGTDASNYFEYTLTNYGSAFEDCWNFESVKLTEYSSSTGSPDLAAVEWMQILVGCSGAIATGNLRFDHIFASTGNFTLQNVARGSVKYTDLRVGYRRPSSVIDDMAKQQSLFWNIDYERDIHLFASTTTAARFNLTDSSLNFAKLNIETDISKLANRVIVRGAEAPSGDLYTQNVSADGAQTSFTLDYKPQTLTMTVAGTPQTLGVEGFVDEATVQWVYNFNEKVVRKTSGTSTPGAGAAIVFTYYPYTPIRVQVTSPASIAAMQALTGGDGVYDSAAINDASLSSFIDARTRGQAEINDRANAVQTATFETDWDGLKSGSYIHITDTSRGVDADFLIQKVSWKQQYKDRFKYNVTASTTLFGIIEFLQMLLKKLDKIDVSTSELVDTIVNADETITITGAVSSTAADKKVYAALKKKKVFDFVGLSGSNASGGVLKATDGIGRAGVRSDFYITFSGTETGSAAIDTAARHSNGTALKLTTAVGGNGNELEARLINKLDAVANTVYTIEAWIEIQTALSNVGTGGGFRLLIKEYDSSGSLLATNTIFSAKTAVQDFNRLSATFTSNASTAKIDVVVSLYRAIGSAWITDIILTPATAETATLPGIASFCQAT